MRDSMSVCAYTHTVTCTTSEAVEDGGKRGYEKLCHIQSTQRDFIYVTTFAYILNFHSMQKYFFSLVCVRMAKLCCVIVVALVVVVSL